MSDWDSGDGFVLGGLWDLFGVFGLDLIWVLTPIRADPVHIFICGFYMVWTYCACELFLLEK